MAKNWKDGRYSGIGPEITPEQELEDYGITHSVTTTKGSKSVSSVDVKNAGLGNPQPGTGNSRHKRTGRRVT